MYVSHRQKSKVRKWGENERFFLKSEYFIPLTSSSSKYIILHVIFSTAYIFWYDSHFSGSCKTLYILIHLRQRVFVWTSGLWSGQLTQPLLLLDPILNLFLSLISSNLFLSLISWNLSSYSQVSRITLSLSSDFFSLFLRKSLSWNVFFLPCHLENVSQFKKGKNHKF